MFCSTTYHYKSRKLPKFKRKRQRRKFFNYCKKKANKEFWEEIRQKESQVL